MKKITLTVLGVTGTLAGAYAQTLVYDGFSSSDYSSGNIIGQSGGTDGGVAWSNAWSSTTGTPSKYTWVSTDAGYTDSNGYTLNTTPGALQMNTGTGFEDIYRELDNNASGTVYWSMIIDRTSTGLNNTNWRAGWYDGASARGTQRYDMLDDGSGNFNITSRTSGGGAVDTDTSTFNWDNAEFVVAKLTTGGGGTWDLWVNPNDLSDIENGGSDLYLNVADNGAGVYPSLFRFVWTNTSSQTAILDEIRISYGTGASIGDVTPFTVPEPASACVLLGAASLASVALRRRR